MKKKHTPVGKVLLAAAKVTPNDRIAQRIANAEYDKHRGWWPLRTAIKKALDAAVRKAAWEGWERAEFFANCQRISIDPLPHTDYMVKKYGPRPRSKR